MSHRPKHLLSHIEASQLLQQKGLVEITDSAWADDNPGVKDVRPTDAGTDEHLRYQTLPRFEDELIQAISYLETYTTSITLVANGLSLPIPSDSTLSETLIKLAAILRDMAGAQ